MTVPLDQSCFTATSHDVYPRMKLACFWYGLNRLGHHGRRFEYLGWHFLTFAGPFHAVTYAPFTPVIVEALAFCFTA